MNYHFPVYAIIFCGYLQLKSQLLSIDNMIMESTSCAKCGLNAENKCGACGLIDYCSRDCQKSHWITHKSACQHEMKIRKKMADVQKNIAGSLCIRQAYWPRTIIRIPSTSADFLENTFHITHVSSTDGDSELVFKFIDCERIIPLTPPVDRNAIIAAFSMPDISRSMCIDM